MASYSFSQLQRYLSCPRMYWYEYIHGWVPVYDGVPRPIGSALHTGVEALYDKQGMKVAKASAEYVYWHKEGLKTIHKALVDRGDKKEYQRIDAGWYQVDAMLFNYRVPAAEEVVGNEEVVEVEMDHGRTLIGTIDRCVVINGDLWVVDTKTTGYELPKILKIHRLRKQFAGYVLMARRLGLDPVGVLMDLIYKPRVYFRKDGTHSIQDPQYHREPLHVGKDQMEDFEGWFHHVASRIEDDVFANGIQRYPIDQGWAWPMNTEHCMAFNRVCPYFEVCRNPKRSLAMLENSGNFMRRDDRYGRGETGQGAEEDGAS